MSRLEDFQPNTFRKGVLPDALATVVSVQWFGPGAVELTYKDPTGKLGSELLYRHDAYICLVQSWPKILCTAQKTSVPAAQGEIF